MLYCVDLEKLRFVSIDNSVIQGVRSESSLGPGRKGSIFPPHVGPLCWLQVSPGPEAGHGNRSANDRPQPWRDKVSLGRDHVVVENITCRPWKRSRAGLIAK